MLRPVLEVQPPKYALSEILGFRPTVRMRVGRKGPQNTEAFVDESKAVSSAIPAEGSNYCLQPETEPAAQFRNASLKHSLAWLRNPA